MKFSDKFSNYENKKDLVGKYVLYERGQTYSKNRYKKITTISKVTKTGFRINEGCASLFSFDGYQKGLTGRMDIGIISRCILITKEEALEISNQWKENKKKKDLTKQILDNISECSLEELEAIFKIMT